MVDDLLQEVLIRCVYVHDDSPEIEAAYQGWLDQQHQLRAEEPRSYQPQDSRRDEEQRPRLPE